MRLIASAWGFRAAFSSAPGAEFQSSKRISYPDKLPRAAGESKPVGSDASCVGSSARTTPSACSRTKARTFWIPTASRHGGASLFASTSAYRTINVPLRV